MVRFVIYMICTIREVVIMELKTGFRIYNLLYTAERTKQIMQCKLGLEIIKLIDTLAKRAK